MSDNFVAFLELFEDDSIPERGWFPISYLIEFLDNNRQKMLIVKNEVDDLLKQKANNIANRFVVERNKNHFGIVLWLKDDMDVISYCDRVIYAIDFDYFGEDIEIVIYNSVGDEKKFGKVIKPF